MKQSEISYIKKIVNKYYNEALECFGCSSHILFWNYDEFKNNLEYNFEAFLYMLKKLIDNGEILVLVPYCFYDKQTKTYSTKIKKINGERAIFWDIPSDEIINYTRSVLPKDLNDISNYSNSKNYGIFWYDDCPQIRWVYKETGKIY